MLISQFDHDLSPYELEALIRAKRKGEASDVYIIDVRDPDERTDGRVIPFSLSIPSYVIPQLVEMSARDFKAKYGVSRPGRKSRILLFCRNGRRSGDAAAYLRGYGFTQAVILTQGYEEWAKLAQTREFAEDM